VDNYNNIPACILNFTGKFNNIKKICSISAVWEYNFEMNMFSDKPIFYVGINKCIEQDNEWFILDDNNEIDLFRHSERHTYPYNMDNMIGDYFDKPGIQKDNLFELIHKWNSIKCEEQYKETFYFKIAIPFNDWMHTKLILDVSKLLDESNSKYSQSLSMDIILSKVVANLNKDCTPLIP
jgi:hypothetical protein